MTLLQIKLIVGNIIKAAQRWNMRGYADSWRALVLSTKLIFTQTDELYGKLHALNLSFLRKNISIKDMVAERERERESE